MLPYLISCGVCNYYVVGTLRCHIIPDERPCHHEIQIYHEKVMDYLRNPIAGTPDL